MRDPERRRFLRSSVAAAGTRERGVSSLEVNPESPRTILARQRALFAAMRPRRT